MHRVVRLHSPLRPRLASSSLTRFRIGQTRVGFDYASSQAICSEDSQRRGRSFNSGSKTNQSLHLTSSLSLDDRQRDQNIRTYCEHDHLGITTSRSSITTYPLVFLRQSSRVHLSTTCDVRRTSIDSYSQRRSTVDNGSDMSQDLSSCITDRRSSNYKLKSSLMKCRCPMKPCKSIRSVSVTRCEQQRDKCSILETLDGLQRFSIGHCRFSRWLSIDERRQVSVNPDERSH
jgi:hypothetical protein